MPMKLLGGLAVALGLALLVLCWPRPAKALNLCLLNCSCGVSTGLVTFGSYNALASAPTTAAGNVQVSCTLLSGGVAQVVVYSISLSAGSSGSFASRTMARAGGGGSLAYNLYDDAGMTQIWGDGTGGSQQPGGSITAVLVGTPVSANYPVYGRIPANQAVAGGSYSDTITVSMSF